MELGEPPRPQLFAVATVRPLSPMQLATSMWIATTDPLSFAQIPNSEEFEKRIEGLEGRARGLAGAFARPGEDYQIGVSEALLMSNSDRLNELFAEGGDRLVSRLKLCKYQDERIELAVQNVLSRPLAGDELAAFKDYLAQRDDRPIEAYRQLLWALLSSAEFRFNY